jgi:hypothetical protein
MGRSFLGRVENRCIATDRAGGHKHIYCRFSQWTGRAEYLRPQLPCVLRQRIFGPVLSNGHASGVAAEIETKKPNRPSRGVPLLISRNGPLPGDFGAPSVIRPDT